MTIELTALNFEQALRDASGPALVDFYAPWCHPCRLQLPVVDKLVEEADGHYAIYKVNVDESPQLAQRYGVRSLPTLIVFRNGEIAERFTGLQPKQSLQETLRQAARPAVSVLAGPAKAA